MEDVTLKRQELAGLLKQGAAEMHAVSAKLEKTAKERDVLLKFAQAVEILPALEKAAVVRFPSNMSFSEKALRLTKKSTDELDKLAYMAENLPDSITEMAKVAESEGEARGDQKVGRLTQFVLNQA